MSTTMLWILFGLSFVCYLVGGFAVWGYIIFKRRKKMNKDTFGDVRPDKYKIFSFWQHYSFIFLAFACFLGGVILMGVTIPVLV